MPYFLGTDEAGYGPNLGPLVVTVTAWRVPDGVEPHELYERLADIVTADGRAGTTDSRLPIADSKLLYQPQGSLAKLERTVLAAGGLLNRPLGTWRDAWSAFAADCVEQLLTEPWFCDYEERLPLDCLGAEMPVAVSRLADGLRACEIELVEVRSRVLFPAGFNDLCDAHGSKGTVLSETTLGLVAEVMRHLDDDSILVVCDKHGGRNKYAALLQSLFSDCWIEVCQEGRLESVYRWGQPTRRVEARFVAKGEGYLPTALASMVSKYLRELAMRAFNVYWRQHLPNIRPTAGYPTDAVRFRREIAATQARLGITDRVLWRTR